jgi:hypothetical protein
MKKSLTLIIAVTSSLLVGCGMFGNQDQVEAIASEVKEINQKLPDFEPMVLRVSGYGTINERSNLTDTQKRLLAMRASKLDAYRTLAERVYGTAIVGNTTVENLVVQNDRFRTYVETYVLGAKVVSQEELVDDSWETVVEMVIDEGFRNCLTNEQEWRRNGSCASEVVHDLDALTRNDLSRQGLTNVDSGLYFIE